MHALSLTVYGRRNNPKSGFTFTLNILEFYSFHNSSYVLFDDKIREDFTFEFLDV